MNGLEDFSFTGYGKDTEKAIRICGSSWQYCDGNCENCSFVKLTTSNRTEICEK